MDSHWLYYLVKYLSRWWVSVFFGGVKQYGAEKIPTDGAVFFTPNHQGAFMDAVLVGSFVKRSVSFLTRADVFNKWSRPILNALNMMPIYRIRDGIGNLSQNDAIFETCYDMLSKGRSILIFPEGNHSADHFLRPLSKGTARLALDARARVEEHTKIYIIPTGINYFSHRFPLSRVHIKYGDPIELSQYMELYQEHKQKGYNQLKKDLSEAMKSTLILPDKTDDYEQRKEWIYQPKHEDLPFDELKEMAANGTPETVKPRRKSGLTKMVISLLSIFNILPLLGLKKILKGVKDPAFYISIKYLAGALLHILWWSLIFALGVIFISWQAGLLFAVTGIVVAIGRQSLIKY